MFHFLLSHLFSALSRSATNYDQPVRLAFSCTLTATPESRETIFLSLSKLISMIFVCGIDKVIFLGSFFSLSTAWANYCARVKPLNAGKRRGKKQRNSRGVGPLVQC